MTEEHAAIVAANGANGGCPVGTQKASKFVLTEPSQVEQLIDSSAEALLRGRGSLNKLGPEAIAPTDADRQALTRFVGIPAEEFAGRVATKFQSLLDKTMERVHQKLEADAHKPGELTLLLAVLTDKWLTISGRQSTTGPRIGTQINVFSPGTDRKAMLATLRGTKDVTEVQTIETGSH